MIDEIDLGWHEGAAGLLGQADGGRIVGEERTELEPGGMRLEMRKILQGELSAAEDLDGRRISVADDMDGHKSSVAGDLDGRRRGVLHTIFSVSGRIETHCKVTKNSADDQGNQGINSHNVA